MNTKKFLVPALLVLELIIIIILSIALFLDSDNKEPKSTGDQSGLIISNNAIYTAEQMPGYSVSVQIVRLEKPGFVVIHEDADGKPGKILGESALLSAGETENLPPITLSHATKDGETIYAMLHFDNGDGKFNAFDDKSVLDPAGNAPVMTVVVVSEDASEPAVISP